MRGGMKSKVASKRRKLSHDTPRRARREPERRRTQGPAASDTHETPERTMMRLSREELTAITGRTKKSAQSGWFKRHFGVSLPVDH